MLAYLLGDEGGYVVSVAAGEARVTPLRLTDALARELSVPAGPLTTRRMRTICVNADGTGVVEQLASPEPSPSMNRRLAALWQLLVPEPDRSALLGGKIKRLIVVPDGPLALLPFDTLIVALDSQPTYLLDAGPPIIHAPSATVLHHLSERRAPPVEPTSERQPVLTVGHPLYGNLESLPVGLGRPEPKARTAAAPSRLGSGRGQLPDLPYTGVESQWVADVFQKEGIAVAALRDQSATESAVRANVGGRRIVHLACHGLTDQAYGNFFGCLALTPNNQAGKNPADDGFLTLPEIYELPLQTCELAVLSACQTNFGPQQQGEGVWALSRGFLVAGAHRVVASNWLVDDAAAANLISLFCGVVAAGEKAGTVDFSQALQLAKQRIREQDKWKSPYYWGPFVLVGPN